MVVGVGHPELAVAVHRQAGGQGEGLGVVPVLAEGGPEVALAVEDQDAIALRIADVDRARNVHSQVGLVDHRLAQPALGDAEHHAHGDSYTDVNHNAYAHAKRYAHSHANTHQAVSAACPEVIEGLLLR